MRPRILGFLTPAAVLLALVAACGGSPPPDGTVTPAAPTNVTATPGEGFVTVAWDHDGANATGFVVYREEVASTTAIRFVRSASDDATWVPVFPDAWGRAPVRTFALEPIGTVEADVRTYRDDDVEPGTDYRYAVAAKGAGGRESSSAAQGGAPVTPEPPPDPDPDPDPDPEPRPVGENPDPTRYLALLLQDEAGNAIEGASASIVLVRSNAAPRFNFRRTSSAGVALLVDLETQVWIPAGTYDALLTVGLSGGGTTGLVAVLTGLEVPGTIELAADDPRFTDVDIELVGTSGPRAYVNVATQLGDRTVAGYPLEFPPAGGTLRADPGSYELFVNALVSSTTAAVPSRAITVPASSAVTIDVPNEPSFTLSTSFDSPPGAPATSGVVICLREEREALWIASWNCLPASSVQAPPGTYVGSVQVMLADGSERWWYSFELATRTYGPVGATFDLSLGGLGGLTVDPTNAVYRRNERVTFVGGLADAGGTLVIDVQSTDGSTTYTRHEMRLLVTDPNGAPVHDVSSGANLLSRPWEHEYRLPSDAPGGTYTVEVAIDTGPYLGPLTASTTFFVDAPGEPPDLEATVLWQTEGFTGTVFGVAWDAARGRVIASGTGGLRAHDAVTGDEDWVSDACNRGSCHARDLAFLGDTIVVATSDGLTTLDAESGTGAVTVVRDWDLTSPIIAVALRPGTTELLTVGVFGEINLWDTDTWTVSRSYELDSLIAQSAAWSPDGSALALGTSEGEALVLDADDGAVLTSFSGHAEAEHSGSVNALAWSPDGTLIASGGGDERVRVWHADDGEELAELQVGDVPRPVYQVAWSPAGDRLAAVGADGALIIQGAVAVWDADGWDRSWTSMLDGPSGYAYAVTWSPDGTAVFTGDKLRRVTRWDATTGTPSWARQGDSNEARAIAWAPGGDRFVIGTRMDNGVSVWSTGGDLIADLRSDEGEQRVMGTYVDGVDWSSDGTRIVSVHGYGGAALWDATTYEVIYTLSRWRSSPGAEERLLAVRFSPDGAAFIAGNSDATARVWRTTDGVLTHTLSGHSDAVDAVDWSPDGALIATASRDGTARIWDADTGDELLVLDWGARSVYSVAFSPDGATLATGGDWSPMRLWDPLTGELLRELHTNDSMFSLSWSPDGALLAGGSTSSPTTVWNAATGGWKRLDAVGRTSLGVAWSPAGQHLAVATWNPAVTLAEFAGDDAP